MPQSIYDHRVKTITGEDETLAKYQGQVLLIVNTASQCGFTPQYEGLQTLHQDLAGRDFSVLAFPCDQFGHQEPGADHEIAQFCEARFQATFPLFSKVEVNGPQAHALFVHLKNAAPGMLGSKAIKWNFTKFLVGRDGRVLKRYAPVTSPETIRAEIETMLG